MLAQLVIMVDCTIDKPENCASLQLLIYEKRSERLKVINTMILFNQVSKITFRSKTDPNMFVSFILLSS